MASLRLIPLPHFSLCSFLSKKIWLNESWTAASGVEAPDVTPIVMSFSRSNKKGSVTISPSTVRCVIVLSAPMHSARLMWKDLTPLK